MSPPRGLVCPSSLDSYLGTLRYFTLRHAHPSWTTRAQCPRSSQIPKNPNPSCRIPDGASVDGTLYLFIYLMGATLTFIGLPGVFFVLTHDALGAEPNSVQIVCVRYGTTHFSCDAF